MSTEGKNMDQDLMNEQMWQEELEGSPLLQSLKAEQVFDVPDGYFNQVSSRFAESLAAEAAVDHAPFLRQAGTENIFRVPTGYFEQLPGKIERLIGGASAKVVPFWGRTATRISTVAAAIMLLISVVGVSNQVQTEIDPVAKAVALTDGLSEEEIMLVMSLDDASSDEFIELLDQEVGEPSFEMLTPPGDDWLEGLNADEIEDLMLYDM